MLFLWLLGSNKIWDEVNVLLFNPCVVNLFIWAADKNMQGASSKTIHWDRKLLCWLPQFQRCSIMGDSWDGGRCMFTAWFYSRLVSSHRTSPLIFFPPTLCSETLSLYALSFKKACTAGGTKLNFDWLALLIPILLSTIIILINQWQRESCLHNRMFISNEYCTEFNERASYQMAFLSQLKNLKKVGRKWRFWHPIYGKWI